MHKILIVLLLTFVSGNAWCQGTIENSIDIPELTDINSLTQEDYINLKLPPLGVLMENSKKNPVVEYFNERKIQGLSELKSVRRNWLTFIRLSANYQYGVMNDYSYYTDAGITAPGMYHNKSQSFYNVGATFSFPLIEIFDRRNKIKRQKTIVKQSELEAERWNEEQNLKIVDAYTTAVESLSTLKSMTEAVTIANAQYEVTEQDFINGKADAQTLSRQKNIQTQTISTYEQTRAALNNALLRLELLSRTKIINK